MALKAYQRKRDFRKTPEPRGPRRGTRMRARARKLLFVVQEHRARRLHWDFRLESAGVLKSWAVTREPVREPGDRRLAVETEDHPLEYAKFRGKIPTGEYGAGTVKIWDNGTYESDHPIQESMEQGAIKVTLHGKKLKGDYVLARIQGEGARSHWLFFKSRPKPTGLKVPQVESLTRPSGFRKKARSRAR